VLYGKSECSKPNIPDSPLNFFFYRGKAGCERTNTYYWRGNVSLAVQRGTLHVTVIPNGQVNNVSMPKEPEENPYIKYGAIQGFNMTVLLDTGSYYIHC